MESGFVNCPHPDKCGVTKHRQGSTSQRQCAAQGKSGSSVRSASGISAAPAPTRVKQRPIKVGRDGIADAVEGMKPFKGSNIKGREPEQYEDQAPGRIYTSPSDMNQWKSDRDNLNYVVESYDTPVAWVSTDQNSDTSTYYVSQNTYSSSTSAHINQARIGMKREAERRARGGDSIRTNVSGRWQRSNENGEFVDE